MPWAIPKPCAHPGCKNNQPCQLHLKTKGAWKRTPRESTTKRGYGGGWAARRQAIIARDGQCQTCGDTKRLCVHHIDHDPTNNDSANLITLCYPCHERWHGRKR